MSVADAIRDLTDESDIAYRSEVYEEIQRELTELGLNLAFFIFTSCEHSSCARMLEGNAATCPLITVYLRYLADFRQTGIDPHQGNWDDTWGHTRTVREAVNTILQRRGFGSDYVSDHTFVFVRTLEEVAFCEIGRECKDALQRLICDEAPGVRVSRIYWNGHQYDVIMRTKSDCRRVQRKVQTKIADALPILLAAADRDGYCRSYEAKIEFGHVGMDQLHLAREDL